jgi:hypothetical protein
MSQAGGRADTDGMASVLIFEIANACGMMIALGGIASIVRSS